MRLQTEGPGTLEAVAVAAVAAADADAVVVQSNRKPPVGVATGVGIQIVGAVVWLSGRLVGAGLVAAGLVAQ